MSTKYIVNNVSGQTINGQQLQPYKVYTALLTQNGSGSLQTINSGSLTIGVTYYITDRGTVNWDFTNVGALTNNVETYFVATGTTPNSWGDANLEYNTGAPVATVLENTIGDIVWSYFSEGYYKGTLIDLFANPNKTSILLDNGENAYPTSSVYRGIDSPNEIYIQTKNVIGDATDGLLYRAFLEIRVYN